MVILVIKKVKIIIKIIIQSNYQVLKFCTNCDLRLCTRICSLHYFEKKEFMYDYLILGTRIPC